LLLYEEEVKLFSIVHRRSRTI